MSSLNYMDICRLCLVKEQVSIPIFDGEGDTRQIFVKISTCLPVKVSRDDRLPKSICNNCVYRVETSYHFWNSTLSAEKQLLEWVNKNTANEENVNKEPASDSNSVLETEQLMLKEEFEHDLTDLNKATDQVKVDNAEEDSEEDETDSADDAGGGDDDDGDSIDSGEENSENIVRKAKVESEDEEEIEESGGGAGEQSATPLEPTTFVNVSVACDEPGPSGLQQQTTSAAGGGFSMIEKYDTKWNIVDTSLVTSFKNDADIKPVSCTFCHLAFHTEMEYVHHAPTHGRYVCYLCEKSLSNKKCLSRHLQTHKNVRPYICEICNKAFKQKAYYKWHKLNHSNETVYRCQHCNYSTHFQSCLKKHTAMHTNQYSYRCSACDKGFTSRYSFEDHLNIHKGIKPYKCDICDKGFYSRYNVKQHKNEKHSAQRKPKPRGVPREMYLCEICNTRLATKKTLQVHMKVHSDDRTKILCDICGKKMNTAEHLKLHRRTHTGEKPYVCKECGKRFCRQDTLTGHERVHTGERPYQCEACGKAFSQQSPLVIHMRYHTGERPYQCNICNKTFVCQSLLTIHRRSKCI